QLQKALTQIQPFFKLTADRFAPEMLQFFEPTTLQKAWTQVRSLFKTNDSVIKQAKLNPQKELQLHLLAILEKSTQ
ncbi:hypothetical protein COB21_02955, partial [Candidatus Aerophobetes bacterium]